MYHLSVWLSYHKDRCLSDHSNVIGFIMAPLIWSKDSVIKPLQIQYCANLILALYLYQRRDSDENQYKELAFLCIFCCWIHFDDLIVWDPVIYWKPWYIDNIILIYIIQFITTPNWISNIELVNMNFKSLILACGGGSGGGVCCGSDGVCVVRVDVS